MGVTNALGAFQYAYVDATARLLSEAYPNGQTNLYSYFGNLGDQRLQQIQHLYPNGSLISGFGYAYDAVGQITAWTNLWDTLPARVWQPAYDAADQLTNVCVTGGPSPVTNYAYAYDPAGNRLLAASNGVPSVASYNALNQVVSSSLPAGNMTYAWDAENRLVAITNGNHVSAFTYDGLGRRVQIVEYSNGTIASVSRVVWDGQQMSQSSNAGNNITIQYYPQGTVIAGHNYYYTRDQLGSIREMVDGSGALCARYDYDPYGQPAVNQITVNPSTTGFAYTGFYYHTRSGLSLAPYRAYNAATGTWLSRDPKQEGGGLNPYDYVRNNPVNNVVSIGARCLQGCVVHAQYPGFPWHLPSDHCW